MAHIFKRIQRRQRPQKSNQTDKHASQPVKTKGKIQITGQMKQDKTLFGTPEHTERRKHGGRQYQNFQKDISLFLRQVQKRHHRPAQDRKNHRKDQIYTAHIRPPSTKVPQQSSAESLKMTPETFRTVQPPP